METASVLEIVEKTETKREDHLSHLYCLMCAAVAMSEDADRERVSLCGLHRKKIQQMVLATGHENDICIICRETPCAGCGRMWKMS